jgi:predicted metal-dependent phosphoesterase TrpH
LILLDFHTHTHHSRDCLINPKSLAKKAMKLGIIPAITDHDKLTNDRSMFPVPGFRFIPGEEIRTDKGDLIGLYLSEEIPKYTPSEEAIDLIHEQGGLAYLPHMFDTTRKGIPDPEFAKKVDIIEVFNARSVVGGFNKKAQAFAKENNLPGAAGSDSHFLLEFGSTYTELPDFDLDNPRELMKALPKARIVGKKAPIYVRGTTTLVKFWKKIFR